MDMPELSFLNNLEETPPPTLYHYTSLDAFLCIIQCGKIWASHVQYLNDASEFTYGLDLLSSRIRHLSISTEEPTRQVLLDNARWIDQSREDYKHEAFVASFSEKRDDLSQWRAYCPPGQGVCIGFKSSVLMTAIGAQTREAWAFQWAPARSRLAKVLYVDDSYAKKFDAAIMLLANGAPWPPEHRHYGSLPGLMLNDAVVYKHPAFKDECEWRIVLGVPKLGRRGTEFRVGKSNLIPYVKLDLTDADTAFVSEIIVGPSPNIGLSVSSIKRLVLQKPCSFGSVQVEASAIPYRHW